LERITCGKVSSFGRELTVRMARHVHDFLSKHMRQDSSKEQMAFGLGRYVKTEAGTCFLVSDLILPDKDDLEYQSGCSVCPKKEFQCFVYFRAEQAKASIVEFHSHPGSGCPDFSGIDDEHANLNAEYIREKFPASTTLALVVSNNRFDSFDALAYDRYLRKFRQVDRLEVLGRPSKIHVLGEETVGQDLGEFDRQMRIPGWNQVGLERQRIGILGAGGNGAQVFQQLISIGAGRQGWVAIVDDDLIEESNLPRLPYACAEQIGTPKVNAAIQYAAKKSPQTRVYAYPCRFEEEAVIKRLKACTVLIYCGDNDGGRKFANELAVCYGIPLIEMGCDVQVSQESVVAGGQVRLVLPGENACLVCCQGFDPSAAAIDEMDDVGRAQNAAVGYVRGAAGSATPSVSNLNAMTAQFAVAQFLALVNGAEFAQWDYLHFDQFTGKTIPARTSVRDECPLCGVQGGLYGGDPVDRGVERSMHVVEDQE
jgi:molybdopterin-synthase adenylyltransferase